MYLAALHKYCQDSVVTFESWYRLYLTAYLVKSFPVSEITFPLFANWINSLREARDAILGDDYIKMDLLQTLEPLVVLVEYALLHRIWLEEEVQKDLFDLNPTSIIENLYQKAKSIYVSGLREGNLQLLTEAETLF